MTNEMTSALDKFLREFELTLPESQRWENLTLANDFMFGKVMRNPELCTEMIRRILPDMDIGRIEFVQPQKSEKYSFDTRGVRFDVFAKSDNRKIFDCEIQTSDKKDLPRRTRAYHIMLGLEALNTEYMKKSGTYNDIPDAFVIFICTFDPFSAGRHIYTFSNTCSEVDGLKLNDGAVTLFLNAKGKADDINGELKVFLDLMLGKSADDPFIKRLEAQMKIERQNSEWRRNYMIQVLHDWERRNEGREEGRIEGRAEGIAEGRKEGIAVGREMERNDILNKATELLKSKGISTEEINIFRNSILQS